MVWVAIEDTDTHEVSEFEEATEEQVHYLMDGYRVDKHDATSVHVQDVEDGRHDEYDGVIYRGGFGYNLWVVHKKSTGKA